MKSAVILLAVLFNVCIAFAGPSGQINIPSPDAKGLKEVTFGFATFTRLSPKQDAGPDFYDIGIVTGILPYEKIRMEVGVDYLVSGSQNGNPFDAHPIYFNTKLAAAEDALFGGMPSFAIGVYNLGTYDKPEIGVSTRQNIVYGLAAKTLPIIGRVSLGGYHGSERALRTPGNPRNNNTGVLASWDRMMPEISDRLWLAADYMSGNNANGGISFGGAWGFSKQVALLMGFAVSNPFYHLSQNDGGVIPGGKPAITTQMIIILP